MATSTAHYISGNSFVIASDERAVQMSLSARRDRRASCFSRVETSQISASRKVLTPSNSQKRNKINRASRSNSGKSVGNLRKQRCAELLAAREELRLSLRSEDDKTTASDITIRVKNTWNEQSRNARIIDSINDARKVHEAGYDQKARPRACPSRRRSCTAVDTTELEFDFLKKFEKNVVKGQSKRRQSLQFSSADFDLEDLEKDEEQVGVPSIATTGRSESTRSDLTEDSTACVYDGSDTENELGRSYQNGVTKKDTSQKRIGRSESDKEKRENSENAATMKKLLNHATERSHPAPKYKPDSISRNLPLGLGQLAVNLRNEATSKPRVNKPNTLEYKLHTKAPQIPKKRNSALKNISTLTNSHNASITMIEMSKIANSEDHHDNNIDIPPDLTTETLTTDTGPSPSILQHISKTQPEVQASSESNVVQSKILPNESTQQLEKQSVNDCYSKYLFPNSSGKPISSTPSSNMPKKVTNETETQQCYLGLASIPLTSRTVDPSRRHSLTYEVTRKSEGGAEQEHHFEREENRRNSDYWSDRCFLSDTLNLKSETDHTGEDTYKRGVIVTSKSLSTRPRLRAIPMRRLSRIHKSRTDLSCDTSDAVSFQSDNQRLGGDKDMDASAASFRSFGEKGRRSSGHRDPSLRRSSELIRRHNTTHNSVSRRNSLEVRNRQDQFLIN